MTPLNAREWLEALRAANGPEADFAAEILDTWCPEDEIEGSSKVLEAREAADAAEDALCQIEKQVADQDAQLEAVRQVLIDGGVLRERDGLDDLAGVIAMFVPPVAVEAG